MGLSFLEMPRPTVCRTVCVRVLLKPHLISLVCLDRMTASKSLLGLCLVAKSLNPNFTIHLSYQIFCLMHILRGTIFFSLSTTKRSTDCTPQAHITTVYRTTCQSCILFFFSCLECQFFKKQKPDVVYTNCVRYILWTTKQSWNFANELRVCLVHFVSCIFTFLKRNL